MKTGIFSIAALALVCATYAVPHPYRVQGQQIEKRDTQGFKVGIPGLVVWVDQNGKPVSTQTKGAATTSTPPPQAPVQANAKTGGVAVDLPIPKIPLPDLPLKTQSDAPTKGVGICYAPYRSDGNCKSAKEVNDDFSKLTDYTFIRFYGVDCEQVPKIVSAAKANNKQVFAGIFNIKDLDKELKTLIDGAKSSWSTISTVSIGNELINSGQASVGEVVNAINKARSVLRAAGYQGPVVTVDTFNALIAHPELCRASDYCAANCHAFFDPNTPAANAGDFVKQQAALVSKAAGGNKKTIITESGWPHSGQPNGKAIPSKSNQQMALQSLKAKFEADDDVGLFLFSAFDDAWKKDSGATFGAEKFWGLLNL
ncbi:hypothetical protein FQN55_005707 [Onygenales sp. PD_40]|nr:hypothetical protein FQN55_005707 [Onygenales sp. PD_40]KAK2777920.1 hypothetical protein FQN52_002964 [Onygenales sp. PD_12]KAK2796412.1 hypothetical protein FQN51_009396 [Onygenales sp. PD_10]